MKKATYILLAVIASATLAIAGPQNDKTQSFNQSSRAYVGTGENVLIGGIIVGGRDYIVAAVRARGPSLAGSGVHNVLSNPTLEIRTLDGQLLASNDNYYENSPADLKTLADYQMTPTNPNESALVMTFQPGRYTAIVRGKKGEQGVGIVEFFKLR